MGAGAATTHNHGVRRGWIGTYECVGPAFRIERFAREGLGATDQVVYRESSRLPPSLRW